MDPNGTVAVLLLALMVCQVPIVWCLVCILEELRKMNHKNK